MSIPSLGADAGSGRSPPDLYDARPVRPHRSDVPLPPFPPGLPWIGAEPAAAERLTAKGPLLVHFFEAGELSSVQSLALVDRWAGHYADAGLSTIGVHTPRSELARSPEALAAAVDRLGIGFPVCGDDEYRLWHAYGCKGWPSLFLWGRGGRLRWFHFGIADLAATEEAIREELRGPDDERELPAALSGPPAGKRRLAKPSDEVFPGGAHDRPWSAEPGEPLEVSYAGAGAWAALDGEGAVTVAVDDGAAEHTIEVAAPGIYELAEHGEHGMHEVSLSFEGEVRVWAVAFSAGPPGPLTAPAGRR